MGQFDKISEPFNEEDLPASVKNKPDFLKLDQPFSTDMPTDAKLVENAREVAAADTAKRPSLQDLLATKENNTRLVNLNKQATESDEAAQKRILAAINAGETIALDSEDLEEVPDMTAHAREILDDGSMKLESADLEEIPDMTAHAREVMDDGTVKLESSDLEEIPDMTAEAQEVSDEETPDIKKAA
ncbi:MAG: hypothetical protein KC582_03130 [Candidatus Magasanikbacteria bacterium]|nr:hypothetical protein [Candidatus Magasanikbacteria bacterium]MCA9391222.1 hypothetical protein [Candidatus Magasanikbacteria bacterium]